MPTYTIDPTKSDGGIADLAVVNALNGNLAGAAIQIKAGTFMRLGTTLQILGYNYTLGYYGTGAKPILSGSKIKTGTWTLYSGNTWSIAHNNTQTGRANSWDTFFVGGQAANGLVTQARPEGMRLIACDTLAHCLALAFTSYYDSVAQVMYVNLGGLNPNSQVMEYADSRYVYFHNLQPDNVTLDAIICVNALDTNIFCQIANGSGNTGFTFTDVDTRQSGSYNTGIDKCSNFQFIGETTGNKQKNLLIERMTSTEALSASFDLLYCDGAIGSDITIDNCGLGPTAWNDITDCDLNSMKVSNIQPELYYDTIRGGSPTHYGMYVLPTGSGANGRSYGNKVTGSYFVNTYHCALRLDGGGGWVFENNLFYMTTSIAANASPNGRVIFVSKQGASQTDNVDMTFSNNIVIGTKQASGGYLNNQYLFSKGPEASCMIRGDKNVYCQLGSTVSFVAEYYQGAGYTTVAAWAAATGMDANSTFIASGADPGFVNIGSLGINPRNASEGSNYLSGFDFTPRTILDGYVADSTLVGFGNVLYTKPTAAPVALVPTTVADASSTWNGTLHVLATRVTANGETLASADATIAVTSGATGPQVPNANAPTSQDATDVGWNIYIGTSATNATKQNAVPIAFGTGWNTGGTIHAAVTGTALLTKGPLAVSKADAKGNPFEPNNMPCGPVQNLGASSPSRQKVASGSW